MGFVNNIKFKKRPLPECAQSDDFITKDLEPGCLSYEISEEGKLLRDNEDGTYTDMNFSGQLYVTTLLGHNDYVLAFNEDGFLTEVTEVPDYAYYSKDLSTPYQGIK